MNCPICDGETIVLAKEKVDRRRKCTRCGKRFTTTEVPKEAQQRQAEVLQTVLEAAEKLKAA